MGELWRWVVLKRPQVLWANLVITLVLAIWAGSMWVAPLMVEEGTLRDLDGLVGPHDHTDLYEDLDPLPRFIYKAGDSQCHQMDNRTLKLNGNQMPFCARCVAIYTLLAVGVALTTFPRMPLYDRITDLKWYWLVVALAPIGIDGVGQLLGYWESTNLVRFITGGLTGGITGIALGFMVREVSPAFHDLREDLRERREMRREAAMARETEDAAAVGTRDETEVETEDESEGGPDQGRDDEVPDQGNEGPPGSS